MNEFDSYICADLESYIMYDSQPDSDTYEESVDEKLKNRRMMRNKRRIPSDRTGAY